MASHIIAKNKVSRAYQRTVFGVGWLGEGIPRSINGELTKAYSVWRSMLERCYWQPSAHKFPTYAGCSVCKEWHDYQNFAEWYNARYFDKCQLDKDLLIRGNLLYSPDTCTLVTHNLNSLFQQGKNTGLLGARKHRKVWQAIHLGKILGQYPTEFEAHQAWAHDKAKEVVRQALLPSTPPQLLSPLFERAEELIAI